jgi:hypothetical protein
MFAAVGHKSRLLLAFPDGSRSACLFGLENKAHGTVSAGRLVR